MDRVKVLLCLFNSILGIFSRDRLPVFHSKILNFGIDHQSIPSIDHWKYNQKYAKNTRMAVKLPITP